MTAEIAILNRTAVTLAADSAVTLQVGGTEKIFNTADKLFELSTEYPVSVMVYNNTNYLEMPFEVIIKSYRTSDHFKMRDYVKQYTDDFLSYLERELAAVGKNIPDNHLKYIINDVFLVVLNDFQEGSMRVAFQRGARSKGVGEQLYRIFLEAIDAAQNGYDKLAICESLKSLSVADVVKAHKSIIDEITQNYFGALPLTEKDKNKLRTLAASALLKDKFTQWSTGIVVAGFGEKELFPTLIAYEIDGVVCNILKKKLTKQVDIDRNGEMADIVPFAQKEMVDRFLYGVDAEYEDAVNKYLKQAIEDAGNNIVKATVKRPKKRVADLERKVQQAATVAAEKFTQQASERIKNRFKQQIQDMVLFMPKQELANLAESLVNLTSTKRRVSAQKETVGGPIDVAVITKSEGFVWVKRKHYFDPLYNPRFFARHYPSPTRKSGGQ